MAMITTIFVLLVFTIAPNLSQLSQFEEQKILPKISFKDLHHNLHNPELSTKYFETLKDGGGKFSAFVVSNIDEAYSRAVDKFQSRSPSCVNGLNKNEIFQMPLTDNSHRITYATITKSFPDCLDHDIISDTFDQVDALVTKLIEKLADKKLDYEVDGDVYNLLEAPTKDHVHVYFNNITSYGKMESEMRNAKTSGENEFMVPFHVDNGLYLLITPFSKHGLQIELSNGEVMSTSNVDTNSIIILFGRGLTEWLLQNSDECKTKFFPAPHAVPSFASSKISYRSVYARMKVVPYEAVPYTSQYTSRNHAANVKTFGEVFTETEYTKNNPSIQQHHASQLCSTELQNNFSPSQSAKSRWRREDETWTKKMHEQCENGTAFCWMDCLPQPQCTGEEVSYCKNDDSDPCGDDSMDPSCHWECGPAPAPPVSTSPPGSTSPPAPPVYDFCRNGSFSTDMNMKGFFSSRQDLKPCIILFFKAWELDTRTKFAFGCIGVIILGIMVEACIALRRNFSSSSKRRFVRKLRSKPSVQYLISILLFGVNLALGYMAMLVAMTYSLELFLCIVMGIMIGHAIFNMKQPVGESIDPCCAPSQNNESKPSETTDIHDGRQGRNYGTFISFLS